MVTCNLTIWPVYDLLKVYDSNSLSGSDLLKMLIVTSYLTIFDQFMIFCRFLMVN